METDRKRPADGPVSDAKRASVDAGGPTTADDVERFQKEAIWRQMNAYKRERDELQAQIDAAAKGGDESLRVQLETLTSKYVEAERQIERLQSPSIARMAGTSAAHHIRGEQAGSDAKAGTDTNESTKSNAEDAADAKKLAEARVETAAAQAQAVAAHNELEAADKKRAELEVKYATLQADLAAVPVATAALELRLKEATAETQRMANDLAALQRQITELRSNEASYEQQIREKYASVQQSLERRAVAAEADVTRIRSARDELLSEINVMKADAATQKTEIERLKELSELSDNATATNGAKQSLDASSASSSVEDEKDLPTEIEALKEKCLALLRQNRALAAEVSGLEQGVVRATTRAKQAVKAAAAAEQKLGVLNAAKTRSDEKYFGAMRARDSLNAELARAKQAVAKSADIIADEKAVSKRLTLQLTKLRQAEGAHGMELQNRQREVDAAIHARRAAESQLASLKASSDALRSELEQQQAEKQAADISRRNAQADVERLTAQLDTQRAISGFGSASDVQEQLESLRSIALCPVCQKNWKNRALTTCGHTMCNDCVQSRLAARMRKCPMCNQHFASSDVIPIHL